jgi:hypothetical protein
MPAAGTVLLAPSLLIVFYSVPSGVLSFTMREKATFHFRLGWTLHGTIACTDAFTVKGFAQRIRISYNGLRTRKNSLRKKLPSSWKECLAISCPLQQQENWSI